MKILKFSLPLQALVFRKFKRTDMPEEFLNKMTDEELIQWGKEMDEILYAEGLNKDMVSWKIRFNEIVKMRKDIYELFGENR